MKVEKVGIFQEIGEDLRSEKLLPGLSAGLVVSLMTIVILVSFASIIFTGPLESHVSKGIGMLIAGSLVFVLVTTLLSSIRSVVAISQDAPVALFAGVAAAISVAIGRPEEVETFITIVVGLILSGILTGICFYLIGRFKLAELFRFIPYPVVSGFLAGTGWLLTKGSLEVMTGISLSPATLTTYLAGSTMLLWLPGAAYALTLFFLLRRFSHFLILPGSLILAIALYYTALWGSGLTITGARELGMLYHPFAESALWPSFSAVNFLQVNWPVIIRQLPSIALIPFIYLEGRLLTRSSYARVADSG
ncbi:MAG: SulP family inorganic anion transporter, partial [Dethiobacteria bacterium]|nr:SulP family inorganic anion transporter [Dethiobacteria bacterium]